MTTKQRPDGDRTGKILDAALDVIGEANAEAFLKWITPELLAPRTSVSAATVRREFARIEREGEETGGFDREALIVALVERAFGRIHGLVESSRETYMDAADFLGQEEALARVSAAIVADLNAYLPGMDSENDVTGQERMFMLAIATCDRHGRIARLLRERQEENLRLTVPIYEAFLARTHRRLAAGVTIEQLATTVAMLLDGAALRRRYHPQFADEPVTDAVLRLFWSFTVARDSEDRDVVAELMRDVGDDDTR